MHPIPWFRSMPASGRTGRNLRTAPVQAAIQMLTQTPLAHRLSESLHPFPISPFENPIDIGQTADISNSSPPKGHARNHQVKCIAGFSLRKALRKIPIYLK